MFLGVFVDVAYFQLLDFDIHEDVKSRYLRQVIEREQEEEANFKLKEQVYTNIGKKIITNTDRIKSIDPVDWMDITTQLQRSKEGCQESQPQKALKQGRFTSAKTNKQLGTTSD